ncbi:hypothetical protein TKK_0019688, partial [Trichogramma kaykai]
QQQQYTAALTLSRDSLAESSRAPGELLGRHSDQQQRQCWSDGPEIHDLRSVGAAEMSSSDDDATGKPAVTIYPLLHSNSYKRILKKYLIGELPLEERFRTENGIKVGDFD